MHEGYGSCFVCVCVCVCAHVRVSVTTLAATYLVYTLKTRLSLLWGFKIYIVWLSLKRFVQKFWRHLLITSAFFAS